MAAACTKDTTYLGALYRRIAARRGKKRALVAVEHSTLVAVWHMVTHDADLGGGYFLRLNPDRTARAAVRKLNQPGYQVTLNPADTA